MGTSWGRVVKEEVEKKNYGIAEYTKCQSTVFAYSSLTMLAVSAVTFGGLQHRLFQQVLLKYRLVSSLGLGTFCAWYLAKVRTKYCQELYTLLKANGMKIDQTKGESSTP